MIIRNAKTFIDGRFRDLDVRYDAEGIQEIGKDLSDGEILDATGNYLIPGLIETRFHGGWGKWLVGNGEGEDSVAEKLKLFCGRLPEYGVTTLIPTIGSGGVEDRRETVRVIRSLRGKVEGSDVYKFYFENLFLNPDNTASSLSHEFDELPSKEIVLQEADGDISDVMMVSLAPELEGGIALIDWLKENGIIPSLVCSLADAKTVHEAADHGLAACTHIFNGYGRLHHRDSSTVAAILTEPRIACQLIADGYHVNPVWIRLLINCKGVDRVYAVSDHFAYSGLPDGRHVLDGTVFIARDGLAFMENGTIFGGNYMLSDEMRLCFEKCGLSREETFSIFTESPAKCLNITDRGRIEVGRRSDFVIMDPDFHVLKTIINGEVVYSI